MDFDLVAFDMDGTLLTSSHDLLPSTRRGLAAIREAGARAMVASGRTVTGLQNKVRLLGLDPADLVLLGCNGGAVVDGATGRTLVHRPLEPSLARELIAAGQDLPVTLLVPHGGELHIEDPDSPWIRLEQRENALKIVVHDDLTQLPEPPLKVIFAADPAVLAEIAPAVTRRFADRVTLARSAPFYLEANPPGVTKGDSLARYCRIAGIDLARVMAFGDQENDLTMLREVGLGVAMGNAIPAVKDAADLVTTSHNDDGIARVLAHHFPGVGATHPQ